ncbi:MAG: hypothetical protein ACQSGP_11495, partial [Frankia sp.]
FVIAVLFVRDIPAAVPVPTPVTGDERTAPAAPPSSPASPMSPDSPMSPASPSPADEDAVSDQARVVAAAFSRCPCAPQCGQNLRIALRREPA